MWGRLNVKFIYLKAGIFYINFVIRHMTISCSVTAMVCCLSCFCAIDTAKPTITSQHNNANYTFKDVPPCLPIIHECESVGLKLVEPLDQQSWSGNIILE